MSESDETGEALDARALVVSIAESQLGEQDPDRYWRLVCPDLLGHPHTIAWCGGFALWCLWQAKLCQWEWTIWKGPGTDSGFLYRLRHTADPQPGDIAYYSKGSHHAIVKRVVGPFIDTLDGNSMAYPLEGVTAHQRRFTDVTAFYSIGSLISDGSL